MVLYIDNVRQPFPPYHEFNYLVTTTAPLDEDELTEIGIKFYPDDEIKNEVKMRENNVYEINMTSNEKEELKASNG